LLAELEKHPWTGAGFATFWSPENYARLELIIGGSAVSAHNGYLEELLNTGIVGLAHFLRCVVVLWQAHRADPFRWLAFMFLAY
jgi:O-antigen ligase